MAGGVIEYAHIYRLCCRIRTLGTAEAKVSSAECGQNTGLIANRSLERDLRAPKVFLSMQIQAAGRDQ